MSRLYAATIVSDPSKLLPASGLAQDEAVRFNAAFTFNKSPRFVPKAINGNMGPLLAAEASAVGDGSDGALAVAVDNDALGVPGRKDTSTRTVFQESFYAQSDSTISDYVASSSNRNTAAQRTGHLPMSSMAPTDPRIHILKPPAALHVGPGAYDVDPMHDRSCGMADLDDGQSHHMTPFHKDPRRPNAVFVSPAVQGGVKGKLTAHLDSPPPDFKSWTSKGFATSDTDRVIKSEEWGASARERRPRPIDVVYNTDVLADGRYATCSAYTSAPTSPAYKVAFKSGMPRLIALPAGGPGQDARCKTARTHADLCGTSPSVGPGVYALEQPRYRSFNAALAGAVCQVSLAASAPVSPTYLTSPNSPTRFVCGTSGRSSPYHHSAVFVSSATAADRSRARSPQTSNGGRPDSPNGFAFQPDVSGRAAPFADLTAPFERLASPGSANNPPTPPIGAHRTSGTYLARGRSGGSGGDAGLFSDTQAAPQPDSAEFVAAADADWAVHQACARSRFAGDGRCLPPQLSLAADQAAAGSGDCSARGEAEGEEEGAGGPEGMASTPAGAGGARGVPQLQLQALGQRESGSTWLETRTTLSAPPTRGSTALPMAQNSMGAAPWGQPGGGGRRFDQRVDGLMFMHRATPYGALIHTQLAVAHDVRRVRDAAASTRK
ncbi:hypothetical protein FOA52_005552 [Chlamydomonas sp. UWO 241]|nr:hypothetical protein FOA52_005552 [Chlamydomonas sp. UWO 241]